MSASETALRLRSPPTTGLSGRFCAMDCDDGLKMHDQENHAGTLGLS